MPFLEPIIRSIMPKQVPHGISDFKELIEGNYYFVDKSLLIKEVLQHPNKVIILPRPRRFGKTLNMTMLRYFLEESVEDRSGWFANLNIATDSEMMAQQGQHPVIFLTFKNLKAETWEICLDPIHAEAPF